MIWTSRLALIAYVLGGWLLPAAHRHVHHHQHAGCQHADVAEQSPESRHGCCGDAHDADPNAAVIASRLQVAAAPLVPVCEERCAVCAARSLTSSTIKPRPSLRACRDSRPCPRPTDPELPATTLCGEPLSRGPPAMA
jgi:hypothetical protein